MASYKVPQDVEADDKLIGPFSFRQFMYIVIAVLAGVAAWGLAQLFLPLAIIPLPIILFFGALALPLRKDQPMEVYLAAILSFYLKPHKRLWDPDGTESLVEVTAPKTVEAKRTKDLTQDEAAQRFDSLAQIVDSRGWATRNIDSSGAESMNAAVLAEANQTQDIMDTNSSIAQSFNSIISKESERIREQAVQRMQMAAAQPINEGPAPAFNPYPTFQQAVVQPVDDPTHIYQPVTRQQSYNDQTTTSDTPVSTDIMNLATNTDLSVETIAKEAHRIQEKNEELQDDMVISLR